MPREGYRTITLSEEAYRTIQKERRPGESWDETIARLMPAARRSRRPRGDVHD